MSVVEINGLTKDYGNDKGIFDVSFKIEKGEVFGILGPNGAGKTTLIKIICGFLDPTKGQVKLNGTDIRNYNRKTIISCSRQCFRIFHC